MPIVADLRINGQTVALVEIRNDGTGTRQRGNYDVLLSDKRSLGLGEPQFVQRASRVEFYDRGLGAVELLRQALNSLADDDAVQG